MAGAAVNTPTRRRGLEKWAPGVHAVRTYDRGWLRRDLVAAVVLSVIATVGL